LIASLHQSQGISLSRGSQVPAARDAPRRFRGARQYRAPDPGSGV